MSDLKNKSELTPWFAGYVKPEYPGVYQCRWKDFQVQIWYNIWDGRFWYWGDEIPQGCKTSHRMVYGNDLTLLSWRGRANP